MATRQRRGWHLDLCQNAVYAPAIRPQEDYPFPGGPGSKGFEPGFFELRSTHLIRAVEIHDPGDNEVCGLHYGKMSMGTDGFARPIACTLPFDSHPEDFTRVSVLIPFANERDTTWQGIEPGFFGFIGAYQTPWWTEAVYHSAKVVCKSGQE